MTRQSPGALPAPPANQDNTIVRAAIHPSIGVARLGNSPDEFFLAPEIVDPPPQPPGFYRDPQGALKRQAVRFRIYGLNASGQIVAELSQSNAAIVWTVYLANKKASWYQFQIALDIPEEKSAPHSITPGRRTHTLGTQRYTLHFRYGAAAGS